MSERKSYISPDGKQFFTKGEVQESLPLQDLRPDWPRGGGDWLPHDWLIGYVVEGSGRQKCYACVFKSRAKVVFRVVPIPNIQSSMLNQVKIHAHKKDFCPDCSHVFFAPLRASGTGARGGSRYLQ